MVSRKKKQMLFLDAPLRMAVRAVKGGGGKPFIGAQRRPLTEQAGGTGACFASEEQLNFVKWFVANGGGLVMNGDGQSQRSVVLQSS